MKWLLPLLLLTGCSGGLTVENDIFNPFQHNYDKYYTHGTKFSYRKEMEKERETYSIGQNIYTPSSKKPDADPAILNSDRDYAGWLYGEYRYSWLDSENSITTLGAQVGCTGPCSMAKQTQRQVHRWLKQSIPAWTYEYTQKSEAGVVLEFEKKYLLYHSLLFQLSPYGLAKAGNIIDNASLGLDARYGLLDTWESEPIIFKGPLKEKVYTAYIFGVLEERYVAYNHFLDGSLWQTERHTVESEPFVAEGDLGFTVGYKNFKATYRFTMFSSEWKEHKGSFGFGGISLEW